MNLIDIYHQNKKVGTAQVEREGLYYRFNCLCSFSDEGVHRLSAHCGSRITDLGICVPVEHGFGLNRKIPVSRIGEGQINVFVKNKDQEESPVIAVSEDKPFPRLRDLDFAVLCSDGIRIKDRSADPLGSDQIQVYPHKLEQQLQDL